MSEANGNLVSARGIEKTFRRGAETIHVLHELDLDIPNGEFLALMGPSGSGKSTLLNLIGGLDRPDNGSIDVGGARIDSMGSRKLAGWRAEHVGFVFQFYNLIPSLTALENVAAVTEIARDPMKQRSSMITGLAPGGSSTPPIPTPPDR